MTKARRWAIAMATVVTAGLACTAVLADDHPYREGPVVNVASIRTEYGKFDDYLTYLSTTWKASQEAAKKLGHILDYKVYVTEPRSDKDPDIYLVVTYKNWAAMDDATAKSDAVIKQVEGSIAKANQASVDRGKIRTVLGSETIQELILK